MANDRGRGDELIERIFAEGDDGQTSNDLLREMFRGYPVEKLIPLLRSDDDEIVKVGAFVAEELAAKAAPLMPDLARLLGHRNRRVRHDILEAVFLAATPSDGETIARAIELVNDPEQTIREKAMDFLACADREQLVAGLPHVADRDIATELGWLLDVEESPGDGSKIETRFDDEDRLVSWFAVVAARRTFQRNPDPLTRAAESSDEELQIFAASQLQDAEFWQRRLQRQQARRNRSA